MAMDNSFSLESALERFLARCPKLLSVPQFAQYGKEGSSVVTEDEVVRMLAEVFLMPDYSIPLMGCFRPIARKVVDTAVWLLRFVPNLRSNSNDAVATFDKDRILEGYSVTNFYNGNGKGLDLHELACLAFCRALDLVPSLLGSVLSYFEFAPPPFQRILVEQALSKLYVKAGSRLLLAVRTSYRLLLMNSDSFSKLWDWSCFLDFVRLSGNLELCSCAESLAVPWDLCSCAENVDVVCDLCSCTESAEVVTDIKWCVVKILSFVLNLSYRAAEELGIRKEDAFSCFFRWERFCQDFSLEKAGWYISGSSRPNKLGSTSGNSYFDQKSCLLSSGLDSQLISSSQVHPDDPPFRRKRLPRDHASPGNPFVLTSALQKSFETVSLAVSQKWPVLLYGPSGSGKSNLISKLAQLNGGKQVVSIPMDDQIDAKILLGSYVSTEQPGEFRWQPGSLSQAVLNGYWVVFEDIDKAPSDVHATLLPLLEGASTFVTGLGEEIRVAESFRLFSTISTSKLEICSIIKGGNSISVFWRRVMIGLPNVEDLKKIVKGSYPSLEPIADKLVETFDRVKSSPSDRLVGLHSGNFDSMGSLSRFSLRDLLKWCKRIAGLGFSFVGTCLSAYECYCICQEAVDIFAASSSSVENRLTVRKDIARLWEVPPSTFGDTLYPANKPIIQDSLSDIRIGRVSLERTQTTSPDRRKKIVEFRSSLHLLEKLAASVKYNEPVLMVGETGTGKTTLVQDLAVRLGQKLTVLNLSQQSDVADLLGGFKPMDAWFQCSFLFKEFKELCPEELWMANSIRCLGLENFFNDISAKRSKDYKKWKSQLHQLRKIVKLGLQKAVKKGSTACGEKRKDRLGKKIKLWENLDSKLEIALGLIDASTGMIFSFVEGAFVKSLKNGEWILLDEVNLAPPEILQRVIGVLDGDNGSLCLAERGDVSCISRHPNFRLFACMNPATDAGKRDLPFSLRSRFTEYFVDDVSDDEDLTLFVNQFLVDSIANPKLVENIVRFYKAAKRDAEERLQDGANQKPQYSLRSLYRALEYKRKAERPFGFKKAMYDGFCMFFQTLLDGPSAKLMDQMILSTLLNEKDRKIPLHVPFDDYLASKINNADSFAESYILTKSVRENLRNVARAIFIKRYPVLLQGPTSSGKTSLVRYLAAITGHEFVRINNHEHTDLQEYLGTYITDASGNLVFHEGVLVRAVRNGCWIVLDELNLAPSDVLEALNRLLDDNRELFVPELQETVKAHQDFMLFATQNPPTVYGGRKMLSRAFRNRFVEIHVDEIPEGELSTIIEGRCKIPESYAKKMVDVMKELQLNRQTSKVFAGKHGYITPRDLFRWADRFRKLEGCSYDDLARDGYYLLAERLRDAGEKTVIREVLEKHLRVKFVENDLYNKDLVRHLPNGAGVMEGLQSVIWTESMQRLYFLVERCFKVREPVLLIGETGGGKTTVCQLLSILLGSKLHILNCHQYTETSDFLGGFYPIRERSNLMSKYKKIVEELVIPDAFSCFNPFSTISSDIGQAPSTLSLLQKMIKNYKQGSISCPAVTDQHMMETLEVRTRELSELLQKWQTIFMWQDGPLVHAMRDGDLFLVDEISLADDSVLERLNSVLEPERTLSLAEKGGSDLEKIVADDKFLLLATMNPGGDFGKKELSPALRNRFTEIWVPPVGDINELRCIALRRVSSNFSCIVDPILSFWEWFSHLETGRVLTVRDLLSWVDFVNVTGSRLGAEYACLHGAFLVLLDGLSLGSGISKTDAEELRKRCLFFLLEQMKVDNADSAFSKLSRMQNYGWGELNTTGDVPLCDNMFAADPFYIQEDISLRHRQLAVVYSDRSAMSIGSERCEDKEFKFSAPTTCRNALRVMRAMQLPKPVLLEGSPGVGKTSLIVALGKFYGHKVVRINFSEQTDLMDLLGSDLPVESDEGMKFAWSDGILLQALKEGCWVLLDELNLAPQSVLEGLNAILDHRAEVFIPELGRTFKCPSSFRIFACQNPSYQGGGRKGLPKSFLNRFTKVYVDELVEEDYYSICSLRFPQISTPLLQKLILFNKRLYEDTVLYHKFAQEGSPWEFNLRDVFRSCEIIEGAPNRSKEYCFLNTVYVQRMRTEADRRHVLHLYEEIFKVKPFINPSPRVQVNLEYLIVGNTAIKRKYVQSSKVSSDSLKILPGIRQSLEAAAECIKHQWLCILVGPASSGKTSLIRLLAELTGNVLNELHLSSGTDISEILGCFEQYNAIRNFRFVVTLVECYVKEYCGSSLESSKETLTSEGGFITKWFVFLSSINHDFLSCFTSSNEEDRRRLVNSLTLLVEIMQQLKLVMEKNVLSLSRSNRELDRATRTVFKLLAGLRKRSFSAKFEWVSGQLVKAIDRGEWIVLENANCCNPTVLDRINSLVEPLGSITINECGSVDGKPVTLHPHPNFRIFLTVNPSYGEVSRAMRNRGIEIFLMQPCWLLDESFGFSCDEFELNDVNRFLALSGIPIYSLVQAMAKSHLYARKEGLRFNISITYLELARWVQLFQQLIMDGNQPIWSLQTSWEYVYLSSFGEANGGNTVRHAKDNYLSISGFSDSSLFLVSPLCLPGGWPMPLKLRDLVLYSRECTVKQNCMYLVFLAVQYASCKVREKAGAIYRNSTASSCREPSLTDVKMLHQIMFPCDPNLTTSKSSIFDLELATKELLFAANWAIEQASESDLRLYLLWFRRFSSGCQLLSDFSNLVERVMEHPIWKYMTDCYLELSPYLVDDVEKFPTPILSVELVDEATPNNEKTNFLCNAINCVGPLKLTYKQWSDECKNYNTKEVQSFIPILTSLRRFEEDFLKKLVDPSVMLVRSPSFDILIQMYTDILEDHIHFWNNVKKYFCNVEKIRNAEEDLGKLLISWRLLLKGASKLKDICPVAFDYLLEESKNLEKSSSWRFHSEKSLLWIYGGHPILPSSALLFEKQLELLKFCESCWPTERKSLMERSLKPVENRWTEIVASSNSTLRFLVMEGVSMLYCDEDEVHIVPKLDEISEFMQKLVKWFEQAKHNLEKILRYNKLDVSEANPSTFCSFSTEILCQKSGFESWQCTLPLIDTTSFYLDMELLQELSSAHWADSREFGLDWTSVSRRLKCALNFSLVHSSRPPQMFLPHQKILSILDTWTSVDAVNTKFASFVHEMWFRWHQFLWIFCAGSVKSFSEDDSHDISVPDSFQPEDIPIPDSSQSTNIPVPDMLFQPVMMNTVFQILQRTTAIKDYLSGSLKLKVASCSLWRSLSPGSELPTFLLSAVQNLFEQIIIAHQKAFDAVDFEEIKSNLRDLRTNKIKGESLRLEKLQRLRAIILSSSHNGLKTSMEKFIAPLLMELYRDCSSSGCISNLGRAWLHLGVLRLNLLLSCDDLDPAMKYRCKDSQLAGKISSLKLEIQVRRECNFLAGWLSTRECDKKQVQALENSEVEKRKLQRKIVFRSNYKKFKNLKHRCIEFLAHALSKSSEFLWSDIEAMSLEQIPDQGDNWQSTATAFIEKLSDGYPEYIDFVQPVQVAVYEMKLGFSLVVSSLMQKRVLSILKEKGISSRADQYNMDVVRESIYTFMRFPLASPPNTVSINLNNELPEFSPYEVEMSADFCAANIDILKELVNFSSDAIPTNESISPTQLEASLYQNILFRIEHFVSNTQMMDSASFMILESSFEKLADFWKRMKNIQAKSREEDSQQYKFRTRAFKIDSIIELDISTLERSVENGGSSELKESFSAWKELVSEDQHAVREDACKEHDDSEEVCNPLEESVMNNVVHIHDKLFGLNSFFINPGAFQISDEDRFLSFSGSYTIGTRIIRGLEGSFLSNLDARLAPEHLLHLCLEHEQKFVTSHKSAYRYNFYKDSNALEMSKMVKLLFPLQQRVYYHLKEWEDHHGLQKILHVIKMLLHIPVTTPLAKVLSGLQFLVNNIQMLQENGSKFSFSEQLEPILILVVSWHKMEFESWPVLLDEVQHQYDINAGKLWFPLYPILLKQSCSGMNNNILGLDDFIQTSSIGEFRRRLQLLFAFLGQIHTGLCLRFYSSSLVMENLKILYNVFGFYAQFLPRTLEHIEDSRKGIEKELKELLKLCSWERPESFLSVGNSKRTRQKFRKLVQKYNDFLQQPVMLFLNKDAELKKGVQSEHVQKFISNYMKTNTEMQNTASDLTLLNEDDRFIWYADWRKKADDALKSLNLDVQPEGVKEDDALKSLKPDIPPEGIIRQCSASQSTTFSYRDAWNAVGCKLKRIFRIAVDCDDLWKEANKSQQKRRALSELLKLLESIGLSRHKPVYIEDQVKSWWFLQPLHEFKHLLPAQNGPTYGASNVAASLSHSESLSNIKLVAEWTATTESYFRSVASVLLLQQICLNSHKDFTREQVDRSGSFLHQLVELQQRQHATASVFAKHLKQFKECVSILKNLHSNCTTSDSGTPSMFGIVQNQDAIFRCMWQQKKLFDSLCSISHDEILLLRTFENTHLETCETVKASSHEILASIEKFFPYFKNSKELLDNTLLGQDRDITKLPPSPDLFVISEHMEELVSNNFHILSEFANHLAQYKEDVDRSSVKKTLLGHFEEVLQKGRLVEEEFISTMKGKNVSVGTPDEYTCQRMYSELEAEVFQAIKSTFEHIKEAMEFIPADEILGSISSWRFLFESLVTNLSYEHLCNKLLRVISFAKKLLIDFGYKYHGVYVQLEHLHLYLDIMSNFGDALLQEHLDMHKTVSAVTCVLADVLASLYSKGYGICNEDQDSNASCDSYQDASGTGMGEGVGKNDVSDQITDEDQLLGASNKPNEEQDASGEAPNKNDKGIEMEQDFEADTFDVSEDSDEDMGEDGEEEQLDSAMGETGADSEVVNEKLWNKDVDENPDNATEKYESGPSVRDADASSRELRAKEDSSLTADESGELNPQEVDKSDGETGKEDDLCDDGDDMEDVNLDKEEAFTDSAGLKPDDLEQQLKEDMDLDKEDGIDSIEEADPEVQDESADYGNSEEDNLCPNDETMAEAETRELDMSSEGDELGKDLEQNAETNLTGSRREMSGLGISDSLGDAVPNSEFPTQLKGDLRESDLSNMVPESNWSNNNETHVGLAPLRGLQSSNTSEMDRMASESSNSRRDARDQPQTQLPQHESSSVQKNQPNPSRSHGDPYKDWKERVKVFVDLEADDTEAQDEIQDDNAEEFGYVPESEQGTSQALGLATSEQIDSNVNINKTNENEPTTNRDDLTEMETEKENSQTHPLKNNASFLKSKIEDKMPLSELEETPKVESQEIQGHDDDEFRGLSDGFVSVRKPYFSSGVDQLSKLSINDSELGKAQGLGDTSTDVLSTALWRRYELLTTRLSQELAEQLRLVMEPTLASKLQGDYKTGKRINMKKVIPYIASNFRRDNIWLRRTRPNKRDYQVVIAVDDSRSMSESRCGNVALESLVAVFRAMSQLEMGDLAVASFGKKGNIRLLHDFGQPFTGETGVKMISSFTFKQENTIADEPVVDLLEYLHNKLDAAVVQARLPSGRNPLQQLVLIIADGRLHEKDKLKRRVQHFSNSSNRLVAFLILDSPQDSIVDLKEVASWERGKPIFSKYMDSFPFPYYIVLRNTDALPRTLADLLRQWFELMQYSNE